MAGKRERPTPSDVGEERREKIAMLIALRASGSGTSCDAAPLQIRVAVSFACSTPCIIIVRILFASSRLFQAFASFFFPFILASALSIMQKAENRLHGGEGEDKNFRAVVHA